MQVRHWHHTVMGLVLLGGLATAGFSQDVAMTDKASPATAGVSGVRATGNRSGRGSFGFMAALDRTLGLTPEQRDSVRGLLAEQRQQSQALREQTDAKIRALLSADQQKKFDAMLAEQKTRYQRKGQSA
jgi:hypothetical protein